MTATSSGEIVTEVGWLCPLPPFLAGSDSVLKPCRFWANYSCFFYTVYYHP